MARITLERLRHSYLANPANDADWALRQIDVEWADGGAYALLGPSGCGKTTLHNVVSGLLRPTRGRVLFDAADVTGLDPADRHVAQVFQFPVIYDTMTVYGNLAFPLRKTAAWRPTRWMRGCARSRPCSTSTASSRAAHRGSAPTTSRRSPLAAASCAPTST